MVLGYSVDTQNLERTESYRVPLLSYVLFFPVGT